MFVIVSGSEKFRFHHLNFNRQNEYEWINKKILLSISTMTTIERTHLKCNRNISNQQFTKWHVFFAWKKTPFDENRNHFYWQFISCCRKQDWFFYWLHIFSNTTTTTTVRHQEQQNRYSSCCVWFFKVVNVWKLCVLVVSLLVQQHQEQHRRGKSMNCALAHCSDALTQIYIRHT